MKPPQRMQHFFHTSNIENVEEGVYYFRKAEGARQTQKVIIYKTRVSYCRSFDSPGSNGT